MTSQKRILRRRVQMHIEMKIVENNNDRTNQLKINLDVTWFVICYKISKGTPKLNMNGNQSLTLFLIHHPNQRWNNSRWVINFY